MVPNSVLYLDLDDTLISWETGRPEAAPGARDFLLWALEHYEIRWLTTWCPTGEMEESLLYDLCKMLRVPPRRVHHIRGFDWEAADSKLNGIAWLEHLVLERPFLWLEDNYGVRERELRVLAEHGLSHSYRCCNVTEDPQALVRLLEELRGSESGESDGRAGAAAGIGSGAPFPGGDGEGARPQTRRSGGSSER